jgi:hypothetical protein
LGTGIGRGIEITLCIYVSVPAHRTTNSYHFVRKRHCGVRGILHRIISNSPAHLWEKRPFDQRAQAGALMMGLFVSFVCIGLVGNQIAQRIWWAALGY